ncbi:MAG: hypothetical protein AB1445_08715 [Bacillota bacterium]
MPATAAALTVTFAVMVYQLSLTRIFSFLLWNHLVFLVVSLAVMGLSLGALLVQLLPDERQQQLVSLTPLALAAGPFMVGFFPYAPGGWVLAYPALATVALLGAGLLLARAYRASPGVHRTYAADLAGAALGSLAAPALMSSVSPLWAPLWASVPLGLLLAARSRRRWLVAAVTGALAAAGLLANPVFVPPRWWANGAPKPLFLAISAGSELVDSRWDATARTDTVRASDAGDLVVFIDGSSASYVYPPELAGRAVAGQHEPFHHEIGLIPFQVWEPGRVLVLGPGGGRDVVLALAGGAREITGVELNRGTLDALEKLGRAFWLDDPRVTVIEGEGRSFVQRDTGQYDVIFLAQVMTQASEAYGLALSESYVYTVEAFAAYFQRLTPGGVLALVMHGPGDAGRALVTAARALLNTGVSPPAVGRHLAVLTANRSGHPASPLVLVGREPLDAQLLDQLVSTALARRFEFWHLPGVVEVGWLRHLEGSRTWRQAIADLPGSYHPVTDDRPFFYNQHAGPSPVVMTALAAALVLALGMTRSAQGRRFRVSRPLRLGAVLAGVGFMLVEIPLLQRMVLLAGQPTLAFSLGLAGLLVGSAAGALLGNTLVTDASGLRRTCLGLAILFPLYDRLWQAVVPRLLAAPPPVVTWSSVALVALAGVGLGVPFSSVLRLEGNPRETPLAYALSGVWSVAGASLALALAMQWGFTTAVWAGALAYGTWGVMLPGAAGPSTTRRATAMPRT